MYIILIENKPEPVVYNALSLLCADYSLPYRTILSGKRVLLRGSDKVEIVEVRLAKHTRKRK